LGTLSKNITFKTCAAGLKNDITIFAPFVLRYPKRSI
jgi:hypothetical protein